MVHEVKTVGVVGLGTMGAGIAEVFARNGFRVVGVEQTDEWLARGRGRIEHSTDRAVKRGKLTAEEQRESLDRIALTAALADLKDADLVVEAVPEHLDLKRRIFAELDGIVQDGAILATNTSSLSVTEISVGTHHPSRVIGMHFFNPAPVLKLVEVVRTVVTDPQVVTDIEDLARRLGKTPVVIGDQAGFIANKLLFGYLNHAVSMFEAHYASREDIDAAMKLGCGLPMGPLTLLDLIGLDTAYEILGTIYGESRDRLHAPAPVLKQMATAGVLGRKTGRGFYTYEAPGSPTVVPDALTGQAERANEETASGRDVRTVGIVGSGTTAIDIIEVFARAGYEILSVTRDTEQVGEPRAAVEQSLDEAVLQGKTEQADRDDALGRITGSASLDDLADCDLVIEAVVEELSAKQALFATFDGICRPGAILATTTSSLPVVDLAMATSRPADVVGMHFFDPAPAMKLVEVVRTVATADDIVTTAVAVCRRLDKQPIVCGDRSGFIVNGLLFPYLNDAVRMLEASYASADDIDTAMKLGCGYPVGPFELLDMIGLDAALTILRRLYEEFREPGFAPAPLLVHLVTAGYLGRKAGRGFRDYRAAGRVKEP